MKSALADTIINFRFGAFDQGVEVRPLNAQGGDETVEIVANADGTYSVKSPNGAEWLSIQADGSFGGRPSNGEPGLWEKFSREGNVLTEMPKDGVTRPLVQLIARDL
jgi:hypothetical protein